MPLDVTSAEQYLDVNQGAESYNVSADSIYRWKRAGDFPKSVRIGKGVTRWRMSDLLVHEAHFSTGFIGFLPFPISFSVD